jgi:hypothetical protein
MAAMPMMVMMILYIHDSIKSLLCWKQKMLVYLNYSEEPIRLKRHVSKIDITTAMGTPLSNLVALPEHRNTLIL